MKKQRSSINFLMGVILYNLVMDFPEPLSSMLRNFDWDAYLATAQPISFEHLNQITPYLVTNETNKIKVIGFIYDLNKSNSSYAKYEFTFKLNFVINEKGSLSSDKIFSMSNNNFNVYSLPTNICRELLLANVFYYDLYITLNPNPNKLIKDIRDLAKLNRTDYLKMPNYPTKLNPLVHIMIMDSYSQQWDSLKKEWLPVFKELIKHYSVEDLQYEDTVLNQAKAYNMPVYVKIIEDAIKEKELESFLYALSKADVHLPAENIDELSEYFVDNKKGGEKKSKRRRNRKRNTRKYK